MKTRNVLAIVAVAMFVLVIGQVQAELIDINGTFKMYKPGTDILVVDLGAGDFWVQAIGMNQPLANGGPVTYDDGTTGTMIDCPGWTTPITLPLWRDGGNPNPPPDGTFVDFTTQTCQLFQDSEVEDATSAVNFFGRWSGQNGNLAESRDLGPVVAGATYTLSAKITGNAHPNSIPDTLFLLADGEVMTYSSSVDPVRAVPGGGTTGWADISRTYDAATTILYAGKTLTVRIGITPPHIWADVNGPDNIKNNEDDVRYPDSLLGERGKIDNITLDVEGGLVPDPEHGESVMTSTTQVLSWTNLTGGDPDPNVYVDVWWGTEPNELHPFPDFVQQINGRDSDAGKNLTSVVVNSGLKDDYYWRVNSYLGADKRNDANMIEGPLWLYHAIDDVAPTVEIVTPAQMTWSGKGTPIDATILFDDGVSALTIVWTPDAASLTDPNLAIDIVPHVDPENPDVTVTITKDVPTGDVVTVTMTVTVTDVGNPTPGPGGTYSVELDVYDNACHMAQVGQGLSSVTDLSGNCITGLEELLLIVTAWLDDYSSPGPLDRPVE